MYNLLDESVSLFFQLLSGAVLSSVQPFSLIVVDGLRGRRPSIIKYRRKVSLI